MIHSGAAACASQNTSTNSWSTAAGSRAILLIPRPRRRLRPRQLQAVQRTLARQRRPAISRPLARGAHRIALLGQHRQQRIAPQFVVVVQILVAERHAVHPLRDQLAHRVLDVLRPPMVREACREPLHDPRAPFHLPQQQPAPVTGERAPVELRLPPPAARALGTPTPTAYTLSPYGRPASLVASPCATRLLPRPAAVSFFPVRNAG